MKCSKCGFVFNGKIDACPYCGEPVDGVKPNFFRSKISLGRGAEISLRVILYIILINLFLLSVLAEIFIGFEKQYMITVVSYFFFFGLIVIVSIISYPVNRMSCFERFDFYFLAGAILTVCLVWNPQVQAIILTYAIPLYLVVSTIVEVVFLIADRTHIRPIRYTLGALVRWGIALVLFIFILIPCNFMDVTLVNDLYVATNLGRASVIGCFGLLSCFLINMVLFISIRTIATLSNRYGNRGN